MSLYPLLAMLAAAADPAPTSHRQASSTQGHQGSGPSAALSRASSLWSTSSSQQCRSRFSSSVRAALVSSSDDDDEDEDDSSSLSRVIWAM